MAVLAWGGAMPAGAEPVFDPDSPGLMAVDAGEPRFAFAAGLGWQVGNSELNVRATLATPPMRVVSPAELVIALEHSYSFETGTLDAYDGGQLNVRVNGGAPVLVSEWSEGGYEWDTDGVDGLGFELGWWGTHEAPLSSVGSLPGVSEGDVIQFIFEAGWARAAQPSGPNWTIRNLEVGGVQLLGRTLFNRDLPGDVAAEATDGAPEFAFAPGTGWRVAGSDVAGSAVLAMPRLTVASAGDVVLHIAHAFAFESDDIGNHFDGAQLNVSINEGPPELVDEWSSSGYPPGAMVAGLGSEPGWSGRSGGMVKSTAVLRELNAGDRVQFVCEAGWDWAVAEPGANWTLESFVATNVEPTSSPIVVPRLTIERLDDGRVRCAVDESGDGVRWFYQRASPGEGGWAWTGFHAPENDRAVFDPSTEGGAGLFRAVGARSRSGSNGGFAVLPTGSGANELVVFNAPPGVGFVVESSVNRQSWSEVGRGITRRQGTAGIGRLPIPAQVPHNLRVVFDDPPLPDGFAFIPPGTFAMGDPFAEGEDDELPAHDVFVSGFFIQQSEVTNDQMVEVLNWAEDQGRLIAVPGTVANAEGDRRDLLELDDEDCRIAWNPTVGRFEMKAARASGHPCIEVTWFGAAAWCNFRSEMDGLTPCYSLEDWSCDFAADGYRLPTEAEWEMAARGGRPGFRYPMGTDAISHADANYRALGDDFGNLSGDAGTHPAFTTGADVPFTAPVASFPANGFGLFDMGGNVAEWCHDLYASDVYDASPSPRIDPSGAVTGVHRVRRGGAWSAVPRECRTADRDARAPASGDRDLGFRPVRR